MIIGVLGIQGDVHENIMSAGAALGDGDSVEIVMRPKDLDGIDGLIIPGGESTVIGRLAEANGMLERIKEKISSGLPVFGICAGLILLSKDAKDKTVGKTEQPILNMLDVKVERNSFGRQGESFETELVIEDCNPSFNGVFIRAPSILSIGDKVQSICEFDGKPVAVRQNNMLGTTFHPELTNDASLHEYFTSMIKESKQV